MLYAFCCVSVAVAGDIEAGLSVNAKAVDVSVDYTVPIEMGFVQVGGEGIIKSDDYNIGSANVIFKSDKFLPGLRYGVGFRGIGGRVEDNHDHKSTLAALAFVFQMEHDLLPRFNPFNIPIGFTASIAGSPEPLAFKDTDKYIECRFGVGIHILENATISLEYRYLGADFDDGGYDWDKDDNTFLLGYSIRF